MTTTRGERDSMRRRWFLDGLNLGINQQALKRLLDKYNSLDLVPEGYDYYDLKYISEMETPY